MPTISVIVPVYNTETYLCRCIDSILAQTFTDFELILVDDGSPDSCGAICDEYALKDNRIHVIHQSNTGQAIARNHGLDWLYQNSTSEWIMFVDSDDWIHPEMLYVLYSAAHNFGSKIAACGYKERSKFCVDLQSSIPCAYSFDTEKFFCERGINALVPWAKLYHISLFKDIRYPDVRAFEDEFVTYKILFRFASLPFIDAPLYNYFLTQNSVARGQWRPDKMCIFDAFEERAQYFLERKNIRMYKNSVKGLIWSICSQIMTVKIMGSNTKTEYLPLLRVQLHKSISQHKGLVPFWGNFRTYLPIAECMLPRTYRFFRRVVKHEQ